MRGVSPSRKTSMPDPLFDAQYGGFLSTVGAGDFTHLANYRVPQKVRIAPNGQVSAPKETGRSPQEVRLNPPEGQVDWSNRL